MGIFDILGVAVLFFLLGAVIVSIGIHVFIVLFAAFGNPKPVIRNKSKRPSEDDDFESEY